MDVVTTAISVVLMAALVGVFVHLIVKSKSQKFGE